MLIDNVCKGCAGELKYDAKVGALKCANCGSIVDIPDSNIVLEKRELNENSSIKTSKTKYAQYYCSTCGRSHIADVNSNFNSCPSCGDSNLVKTINVEYMPDGIIPFKLNKEEALNCFKNWIKKCKFAPNKLAQNAIAGCFNGLYLPSYVYNFYCVTNYSGVGITEQTIHTVVNGVSTPVVKRSSKNFSGKREDNFINQVYSASNEISTDVLKKIANFNFRELNVYRPEFLYGWVGCGVNVPLEESVSRAKNEVRFTARRRVEMSLHYDRVENLVCNTNFVKSEFNYLYLPVWACNYKYKNKTYNFSINGVTGKVCGKAPKSIAKITSLALLIAGAIGAAAYFIIKYLLQMQ